MISSLTLGRTIVRPSVSVFDNFLGIYNLYR